MVLDATKVTVRSKGTLDLKGWLPKTAVLYIAEQVRGHECISQPVFQRAKLSVMNAFPSQCSKEQSPFEEHLSDRNMCLKMMDFVLKMMGFVLKLMDFVLKLMDFALKMMDFVFF